MGGGGGGCSGGRGNVGLLEVVNPNGLAPPKPPFSGSGNSPGVSGLSSTEVSKTSCRGCGPTNKNLYNVKICKGNNQEYIIVPDGGLSEFLELCNEGAADRFKSLPQVATLMFI